MVAMPHSIKLTPKSHKRFVCISSPFNPFRSRPTAKAAEPLASNLDFYAEKLAAVCVDLIRQS